MLAAIAISVTFAPRLKEWFWVVWLIAGVIGAIGIRLFVRGLLYAS